MNAPVTTFHRFDALEDRLTEAPDRVALYADAGFAAMLTDRLDHLLKRPDMILSLDVFDTLLLRDNSAEVTRFVEFGAAMADVAQGAGVDVDADTAFLARHRGTRASYRTTRAVNGCREGSLSEIHRVASRLLVGDDRLTADFIAAELAAEQRRLTVNPALAAYVAEFKARGGRVALVSDMYMHRAQILTLLTGAGVDMDQVDLLISSADTKVTKGSGGIFPLVEEALGATPDQFVHLGDSFRGDVRQPRLRGWAAQFLPLSRTDVVARQADHKTTMADLSSRLGFAPKIAMPKG
ncbi:HAD family hydrolase [Aliiroseovarius sp.]|uniref:HAD family hydrolase n=1 Tax=Aliiroseovarius sp. TaxID=1872442 RepID=UPI003BAD0273